MKAKIIRRKLMAVFLIPCVVYLIFLVLRPDSFGQPSLIWTLFNQSIANILLAWGMSFEMTAGNMDFSVGAEMIMGTLVGSRLSNTMGVPGIILGAFLTAAVIGVIKAVLMAVLDMKSMVISIAYTLIIGSVGYMFVAGKSVILESDLTYLGGFPYSLIICLAAGILMYYLQHFSVFGAHCRALGGNEALALTAGIDKKRVETISILIASFYAAISAIITLSRGAGSAGQTGLSSMTTVFGAMSGVFIAFVLTQYIDITVGIVVGVYTMNIITMGLIALNMPSTLKDSVTGGFLLILMLISSFKNRSTADKLRREAAAARIRSHTEAAQ